MSREREHTNLLFAVVAGAIAFVFRELERRQGLSEQREEARREYVDKSLSELREGELGHVERSAGVRSVGKVIAGTVAVLVPVITVIILIASKVH